MTVVVILSQSAVPELVPLLKHLVLLRGLDNFHAKFAVPPLQELIEFRLGAPDNLVLHHLDQPVDGGIADQLSRDRHPIISRSAPTVSRRCQHLRAMVRYHQRPVVNKENTPQQPPQL